MTMRRLALATLLLSATAAAQSADPTGTWLNEDKDGIVRIGDCGVLRGERETGTLCGHVVWIRDGVDARTGNPPIDGKNADPALRGRPIMGLPVVLDMRPSGTQGRWEGRVYNIDDGKTYSGKLTTISDGRLRVEGCVMFVCQGETWMRQAPPDGGTRTRNPGGAASRPPSPAQDRAR